MATTHEHTPLTYQQLRALFADLNPARIKTRTTPGSSKPMSYLEAWDVKAALIRVFGPAAFDFTQQDAQITKIDKVPKSKWVNGVKELLPFPENFNWEVTALVRGTLHIHQTGAEYGGVALSTQTGPTFGDVADFAIKTADSDALKRAAIYLGTQFGLSLYDDGATVDVVKMSMAPNALWPQPAPAKVEDKDKPPAILSGNNPEGEELVAKALQMAAERDNARNPDPTNEDTAAPVEPVDSDA